jgi:hypothetical protein
VPTDNVVYVTIGFLGNAVIDNQHAILVLDGSDMRLEDHPQIVGRSFPSWQGSARYGRG